MTTAVTKVKEFLRLTKPLRIGSIAPDFTTKATPINFEAQTSITEDKFNFYNYIDNSWAILFSHPCDFTPVCTTEIAAFARNEDEFRKRHVKLIGLPVNDVRSHNSWIEQIDHVLRVDNPDNPNLRVNFPIIADENGEVARKYDMLDKEAPYINERDTNCSSHLHTIRSVFFIDKTRTIKAILSYPLSTGRSIPEIIRIIDSLQTSFHHTILTPCNWQPGDDVLLPEADKGKLQRQHLGVVTKYGIDYMRYKPLARDRILGYQGSRAHVHEIDDLQDTPRGQSVTTTASGT